MKYQKSLRELVLTWVNKMESLLDKIFTQSTNF